jgi:hypothetical protein
MPPAVLSLPTPAPTCSRRCCIPESHIAYDIEQVMYSKTGCWIAFLAMYQQRSRGEATRKFLRFNDERAMDRLSGCSNRRGERGEILEYAVLTKELMWSSITRRVSRKGVDSTSVSCAWPLPSQSLQHATTMSDKDMLISMGFDPARVECTFERSFNDVRLNRRRRGSTRHE